MGGRKEPLNWTLTPTGVVEGVGLSAADITVHFDTLPATPSLETAPASTEPTAYADMNKTDLQVLCSQRELAVGGTKAEIIARLEEADGASASDEGAVEEAEPVTEEGADNGGEGDSE